MKKQTDWIIQALDNWGLWVHHDFKGVVPKTNLQGTLAKYYIAPGNPANKEPNPEQDTQAEQINAAYWMLKSRNPKHAAFIHLRYVQNFQPKHIAKHYNCQTQTINGYMQEARNSIKSCYYFVGS